MDEYVASFKEKPMCRIEISGNEIFICYYCKKEFALSTIAKHRGKCFHYLMAGKKMSYDDAKAVVMKDKEGRSVSTSRAK